MCTYAYIYIYICAYIHTYIHIYIYTHTYLYVYIYIYIYIYMLNTNLVGACAPYQAVPLRAARPFGGEASYGGGWSLVQL